MTRSNSLHIMSIPARSFGQLDSKTEYLSVARGAVLLYSGKTRPRAPISMVHGSCHHFSPCARMIVKFISGVIYGTVRNYLPCWANRGELVLASYVTSVTMPEIQPQRRLGELPREAPASSPVCAVSLGPPREVGDGLRSRRGHPAREVRPPREMAPKRARSAPPPAEPVMATVVTGLTPLAGVTTSVMPLAGAGVRGKLYETSGSRSRARRAWAWRATSAERRRRG